MKAIKFLALALIIVLSSSSYAQLGKFNKLKNKVKKSTSSSKSSTTKPSKTSPSSSSSSTKKKGGTPAYDSDDPIYKAYSKVKANLKYTKSTFESIEWKSNIEGSNEKVIKYLKIANEKMSFLKENGEGSKDYYKEFEKEHTKFEEFRSIEIENYEIDMVYEKKMEQYYYWAKLGSEIKDTSILASYKGYNTFKTDFEANRPKKFATSYMKDYAGAVDNYLAIEVYKDIPYYIEKIDRIIKNMHKITERNAEAYKLNAKSFVRDFEGALLEINYLDEFLLEDKIEINKVKAKANKEKSILDNYISSGEYDTYVAKFRKELIDAVRLRPNGMRNSTYEVMAKKGVKKGTCSRASIASDRWFVSRTAFGYPKYKHLPVDLAVTFEGKCYLAYGEMVQDYQGGGVYGKVYFAYGAIQEEMNCNNTNK